MWDVDLRGKDVAVGSDGNPVIVDSPDSMANTRVTKVDGATGAIIWYAVLDSGNFAEDKGIAVGPDGNPVVVMSDSSTGDGDLRIENSMGPQVRSSGTSLRRRSGRICFRRGSRTRWQPGTDRGFK
jgi:DNA-binding beta-propeller fold protein YncE